MTVQKSISTKIYQFEKYTSESTQIPTTQSTCTLAEWKLEALDHRASEEMMCSKDLPFWQYDNLGISRDFPPQNHQQPYNPLKRSAQRNGIFQGPELDR